MTSQVYEAVVEFSLLSDFSFLYMQAHAFFGAPIPHGLVWLLEPAPDPFFLAGLIDNRGKWVDPRPPTGPPLCRFVMNDEDWGDWVGCEDNLPFNFRWQSCTDSLLIARPLAAVGRYPAGKRLFSLECTPSRGRSTCGYMSFLRDFGATFTKREATGWIEKDNEPDWSEAAVRLTRPESHC